MKGPRGAPPRAGPRPRHGARVRRRARGARRGDRRERAGSSCPRRSAAACVRSVAKALPAIVDQLPASRIPVVEHAGGCHCKAVRFRVCAPPRPIAWDCNCSICHMKKNTHFIVPASDFFGRGRGEPVGVPLRHGGRAARILPDVGGVQGALPSSIESDGVAVTIHA